MMKATDLLQKQHRDIEALLERLSAAGQSDEQRIRAELAANLVAHTVIEEETFYPAVKEALPEEILEALEEHGLADVELARLLAAGTGDDVAEARTSVLTALVTRHIRREESEIFKAADRELGDEQLTDMGEQMALRFRQILDGGYEKLLQVALQAEVPGTPVRARAAKKAAGRAPRAKKAKTTRRAASEKARTPSRRAAAERPTAKRPTAKRAAAKRATPKRATSKRPSTKRATAKRAERTGTHKAEMPARTARAGTAATRTRG
jgi:hemerythrin-like domain-containing protein